MRRARRSLRWPLGSAGLVVLALVAGAIFVRRGNEVGAVAVGATLIVVSLVWSLHVLRAFRAAEALALRDPLTGLPNRALLDDRIGQALRRSRRSGEPFATVVLDLDGFKEVNDVHGHQVGDEVLCQVARRLEHVVREADSVARVGGDEFVVLGLGTHDEDDVAVLTRRLRQAVRAPIELAHSTVDLDVSIGWAIFPDDGVAPEALLVRADARMYETKRDNGAPVRRAGVADGIVREVVGALERDELVVEYQPILRLEDGAVAGLEALVRRLDPHRGIVLPAEFIPYVERTAAIREITVFVVAEALRTAHELSLGGYDLGVSVNVPYRFVDDGQLVARIGALVDSYPDVELTLELGPSSAGAGGDLDPSAIGELRRLGVRLALDDFGRGASLTALRALPLDVVKIDADFGRRLGRNPVDGAVVRTLVDLAHGLDLEVVAEGVETRSAWDEAFALGCDLAQGFYAARPSTRAALAPWLAGRRSAEERQLVGL